jgi:predicted DNA-binding transcriptional regulator AlpA
MNIHQVDDLEKAVNPDSQLRTIEQVSEITGLSIGTIYGKIRERKLTPVKKGKRIYFHPEEIKKFEEEISERRRFRQTYGPSRPVIVDTEKKHAQPKQQQPKPSSAYDPRLGQLASSATRLFNAGKNVRDVVVEVEITYELANHFYSQWKESGPEWHLPTRQFVILKNRFGWDEDQPTVDGFITAVNKYIEEQVKANAPQEHKMNLLQKPRSDESDMTKNPLPF